MVYTVKVRGGTLSQWPHASWEYVYGRVQQDHCVNAE